MKTRIAAIGLLTTMTVILTACGGGGSSRPSTEEISKSFQSGKASEVLGEGSLSADVADCMAKVLHDSDLSDKTLNALVDGDSDYEGSDDDATTLSELGTKMAECVSS